MRQFEFLRFFVCTNLNHRNDTGINVRENKMLAAWIQGRNLGGSVCRLVVPPLWSRLKCLNNYFCTDSRGPQININFTDSPEGGGKAPSALFVNRD